MVWILVLHKCKPEVWNKCRRHQVLFNRRLNLPLHGLVVDQLQFPHGKCFTRAVPVVMSALYLMIPVWVPLGALRSPAGFGGLAWGIPLSLQAASAWPRFSLLCALMAEHLGTTWGKGCGGVIRWISPQQQMGSSTSACEVKSVCRRVSTPGGHLQGCL